MNLFAAAQASFPAHGNFKQMMRQLKLSMTLIRVSTALTYEVMRGASEGSLEEINKNEDAKKEIESIDEIDFLEKRIGIFSEADIVMKAQSLEWVSFEEYANRINGNREGVEEVARTIERVRIAAENGNLGPIRDHEGETLLLWPLALAALPESALPDIGETKYLNVAGQSSQKFRKYKDIKPEESSAFIRFCIESLEEQCDGDEFARY